MTAVNEFRSGWKTVVAASVGIGTGLTTLVFYTTGVFLPALTARFGWSASQVMLSVTIVLILASAAGPAVGALADRYGARRVALLSVAGMGGGWLLLALSNGSLGSFYAAIALLTLLGAGTLPITWTRSVVRSFNRQRGLALGVCLVGTGLFGIGAKLLAFELIAAFGWRGGYVGIGLFVLLVTWPVAYLLFHERPAPVPALCEQGEEPGFTAAEAIRTGRFWIMMVSFFLLSLSISGIAPNLERFVTGLGFGMAQAVQLASLYGIGIIVGRLITGWCLDRFWAPGVIAVMLLPTIVAYALLAGGNVSAFGAGAAIFVIGSAAGVEYDALAFLIARYLGVRAYGAIYGLIYIGFAIGAGFGPYIFTRLSDAVGYPTLMVATAIVVAAGASLPLALGRYPVLPRKDRRAA